MGDAGIGAKATAWTAWGAMAKASAHGCKRDNAGRERTKAWMQASDEGNGLGLRCKLGSQRDGRPAQVVDVTCPAPPSR
jgi:hypothetical protein